MHPDDELVSDPAKPLDRRRFGCGLLLTAAGAGFSGPGRALEHKQQEPALAASRCEPAPGAHAIGERGFRQYVDAFNRGDFDGFGRFYHPEVDFHGQGGRFHGRDAVLAFYRQVKARVRETLELRELVVGADQLVADMVTTLQVLEDWPDFSSGPLQKGETRRSENFIWYDVQDGRFTRIRSAHYSSTPDALPAPRGSATGVPQSTAPCASAPAMSAARFAAYIDAFNRDDYAGFGDFYAKDVTLVIAGKRELRGRQAIFDFYRDVKAQTRRTIEVNRVLVTPTQLAAELQSEFLALTDLPQFIAGPMKRGGRIFINTFVIYELRAGQFARIRSAEYRKQVRAP